MRTRTRTQRAAVASVIGALDLRAEDLLATVVADEELPDRATSTAAEAVADVAAVPGIASQVEALATILRAPQRLEIERKYLLSGLPPEVASAPVDTIDQGYIPGREIAERLRRARRGRAARFYRTIKTGRGIARIETEEEIDGALFRRLWPATAGKRVAKRRYHVADGERVWEVDAFTDRELVLAEVELQSESEAVEIPAWLSPWVVREVTGEDEYMNLNLAR